MTLGVQIFACNDSQQLQSPTEKHKCLPKTNCFRSPASPYKEERRIIAVGVVFPTYIFFSLPNTLHQEQLETFSLCGPSAYI